MNRGTIFIALFVIIAIGVIGASQFLQSRPPVEITIGADPLIESWLRDVVVDFNESQPRLADGRAVVVNVQFENDVVVWRDRRWTSTNHPDGWISASSASVRYARDASIPFQQIVTSVAQTPLMIGAFESRADVLSQTSLDWDDIQRVAEAESWAEVGGEDSWRFVNLAFALPDETMVGLGALLSGVAKFADTATLSGTQLQNSATRDWLQPIVRSVPNYNQVGVDAALFMARGGTTSADIAIAAESQWLSNLSGLSRGEPVKLSYPEYLAVLDFPVSMWDDTTVLDEEREAVRLFANWLASADPQATLVTYGLRPADGVVPVTGSLFSQGEAYGIIPDLSTAKHVEFPVRSSDVLSFLSWFSTAQNR